MRAWSWSITTACWTWTICPKSWPGRPEPAAEPAEQSLAGLVGRTLEEVEKLFIAETLRVSGGNRELAASKLGIGERTLYRKIKEYGI